MSFIKNNVYRPPMTANLAQLRHHITAAVQEVTPDMLQKLWQQIDFRILIEILDCSRTGGHRFHSNNSQLQMRSIDWLSTWKRSQNCPLRRIRSCKTCKSLEFVRMLHKDSCEMSLDLNLAYGPVILINFLACKVALILELYIWVTTFITGKLYLGKSSNVALYYTAEGFHMCYVFARMFSVCYWCNATAKEEQLHEQRGL
ncbi:hypothetical protein C0J52_21886 [Blattella germanica]|nr:hypothetical protein C0J52_21886 [Blattella germanica]